MKKLILLVAAAVGVGVVLKSRSEQVKDGAAKVTRDPRVQSALATASEKAAPVAQTVTQTVKEKAAPVVESVSHSVSEHLHSAPDTDALGDVPPAAVDEVADADPVSAPEFTGFETPEPPKGSEG